MKKNSFFIVVLAVFCFVVTVTSCTNYKQKPGENSDAVNTVSPEDIIKRGEYLVTIMGCNDCHSPKKMGPNGPEIIPELLLSGYPSDRPIIKFNDPLLKEGFGMFYPDLTAAAGPLGCFVCCQLNTRSIGHRCLDRRSI